MQKIGIFALALTAGMGAMSVCAEAQTATVTPPLSRPQAEYYSQHPQELQNLIGRLSADAQQFTPQQNPAAAPVPTPGTWGNLSHSPGVAVQNPLLLTDGTVIATRPCTGKWWKLTPDINGSYQNGTWAQIATMPATYGPLFVGSAVLPDGRVIVEGGEYNDPNQGGTCGNGAWTTKGAIYDPIANSWTNVSPPSGWSSIGDAGGIVLPNGTYMQSNCCDLVNNIWASALLNPNTLAWTPTGTGKADRWDEEGMALLQNGKVLNVNAHTSGSCTNSAELYDPNAGTWSATGSTVHQQADCSNPGNSKSFELGPLVVRPDGTAVIFPGILCSDAANTNCANQANGFVVTPIVDIYNPNNGTWSTGPTMPRLGNAPSNYFYSLADAPGAVLPSGNVLFAASPDYQAFVAPTHFFELSLSNNTIQQVGDTADAASGGAFVQNFLVLPTGEVLGVSQLGNIQIYTPLSGSPQASWKPVIGSVPNCVAPGGTYTAQGTQFNGLTEAGYYGDDVQAATNYPIIRIVNNATNHVFYARTFAHSSRSIAPNASVSTQFQVAGATETGASTLFVVANGIASTGVSVNVTTGTCASATTVVHDFNGDTKSDILWRNSNGDATIWFMNGVAVTSGGGLGNIPTIWAVVGTGDFNGDGKTDILWRNSGGDLAIWFMNGNAVISGAGLGNVPLSWTIAGVADFNGDGKADILFRNNNGDASIWFMNGAQVVSGSGLGNIPTVWTSVGTGDFNGDSKADILWRNDNGDLAIWFMNGSQVISGAGLGNVTTDWGIAGVRDFNGDGKSDIVWRNINGDIAMWFLNGSQVLSGGGLGNVPTSWSIVETADFNADGKGDLLFRNTNGDAAIWLMNGAMIATTGGLGNIPTSWSIQSNNAN